MEPIVKMNGVTKEYGQGNVTVNALRGVDLEIFPGEFTAMAGPSGSGKSTLLNILGGLDTATGGRITVEDKDLSSLSRSSLCRLRRDRIGFVFQTYNLLPVLTAFENAEYVLMLQGVPAAERKERVMSILKEVGLAGMEKRFPRELSGGQQQRVAIARAIVSDPVLVLADEPTANVDSKTSAALLDLMAEMNEKKNVTFFFSTHDPAVMKHSRRLLLLKDGKIDYDGKPSDDVLVN